MYLHLHKVEIWVDRIIPLSLFVLCIIIGMEIYYPETTEQHHTLFSILDGSIIVLFAIDLAFKYVRVRSIPLFLRKYWLEIIAIMPIAIAIRSFEYIVPLLRLRRLEKVSDSAHGVLETGSKWGVIVKEAESAGKASRMTVAHSFLRPFLRLPRLAQALVFYERPTGRHHPHDKEFVSHGKASRL